MKQLVFIILSIFSLPSCATIFNKPSKKIRLYTTEFSKIVVNSDTFKTVNNKVKINALRSKYPVNIKLLTDSLTKTVTLKPSNSVMFYSNYLNYGIGLLLDFKNPKRYTYPHYVFINSADTLNTYSIHKKYTNKGELYFNWSIPYINNFKLKPLGEPLKDKTGFLGLSMGMDYFYANNRFLNISYSVASDFFLAVPAPVHFEGEVEIMNSYYLSVSNNYRIKRWSLGYGLAFGENSWNYSDYGEFPRRAFIMKSNNAWGLVLKSYYQTKTNVSIGLIYRPTFIRWTKQDIFQYEHLISIDFLWKIRLYIKD